MADLHVVSALRDKYAHLKGEARKLESDLATIREAMEHIKAAIRLFNIEVDDDAPPIRPKQPSRWKRRNGAERYALDVLRQATEPMTSREIALKALDLAGYPIPDSE